MRENFAISKQHQTTAEDDSGIVTRSPLRVSFVGGGSDLPEYFETFGGMCVGGAITKYNRLSAEFCPLQNGSYECILNTGVALYDANGEKIVRSAFDEMKPGFSSEFAFRSFLDLAALGSGLGASASLSIAAVLSAAHYSGIRMTPNLVAETAYHVERTVCGFPVGKQDHYTASFGGLNVFTFHKNGETEATPVRISPSRLSELESWLLLAPITRSTPANEILKAHGNRLKFCPRAIAAQHAIRREVEPFTSAIEAGGLTLAASILDSVWRLKRQIADAVSSPQIDSIYRVALNAGALGGKILGAGSGGHLLLMAPPEHQAGIRRALAPIALLPVTFDMLGGSRGLSQKGGSEVDQN